MRRAVKRLLQLRPSPSSRCHIASIVSSKRSHCRIPYPQSQFRSIHSHFLSDRSSIPKIHSSDEEDGEEEEEEEEEEENEKSMTDVDLVISSLEGFSEDSAEARRRLEICSATASPELVHKVLSRLRNHWSAAFTFFLWAGNQVNYSHSVREYHSMIGILGKMRRFDTAWSLIMEMKKSAILTPKTLIILIRRYAAARDVAKCISAFYAMKRFGFSPGIEEFNGLLSALCRYKNVADAEHLLFCNEGVFSLETKSFNIVLNGWCNAVVSVREARRFWGEMTRRGILPDAISYSCMICCCSKAGKLGQVLRIFDEMRDLEIEADRKVYNSVIYALGVNGCFEKAVTLMKGMEEKGISADVVTFNSLIRALCRSRPKDARDVFDEMQRRGLAPSLRTFHAIFRTVRTSEEVFDTLELMKEMRCSPESETYVMLIRKLCRWRCHDSVAKLWEELSSSGGGPDRSAYVVLIHGLFLSGNLVEALKYYEEMKTRGFPPEPRTEEMMQTWLSGRDSVKLCSSAIGTKLSQMAGDPSCRSRRRNCTPRPEDRCITRERGFSLLD